MMISDDERREVFARLREWLAIPWYERPWSRDAMQSLGKMVGAVPGEDIVERIADLIERPTCRICATDHEYEDSVRCDRCRMTFRRPLEPFKYCPNCGAEVKDDAEPNLKED